eukprot:TRINITY_DN15661_c0_g1_i2.p1 TRINITY_DN15661_c0_g1~~TRINITY_DN15661_c0_g1_i2.p1  ORF type:complete len:378 (+),score=74.25 TRINITY_DN15661_c0_g1_i2:120-1136(+)
MEAAAGGYPSEGRGRWRRPRRPQPQQWQQAREQWTHAAVENDGECGTTSRRRYARESRGDRDRDRDDDAAGDDDAGGAGGQGWRRVVALRPAKACQRAPTMATDRIESVCVVGGGPSGLACCRALCDAGMRVTLVQESRGLGGKLCTKFVNGPDDPSLHFDMGVQLLQPSGPLCDVLEGAVAPWPAPGRFKRLRCGAARGRNGWQLLETLDLPTEDYVVGVPSMSRVGRHLAAQCQGLEIHLDRTAQVRGRDPDTGRWEVEWKRETATGGQLRYRPELADVPMEVGRGDFDAVVLAFEANKILRGCKSGYKMVQPSATPALRLDLPPLRILANHYCAG